MPVIHGVANWPGVKGCIDWTYTCSLGTAPGVALLTVQPQAEQIASKGNLVITDGVGNAITIPDCRLDYSTSNLDGSGKRWQLAIQDRRWRWRLCGSISGMYNVPDQSGDVTRPPPDSQPVVAYEQNFLPYTIRSPQELMEECLKEMGETSWKIQLPPGADVREAYPPRNWVAENPAAALEALCQDLGCVICYRLDEDRVWIMPMGEGLRELPLGGSIRKDSATIDPPSVPKGILLYGAPARWQMRLRTEAVGEEWDGSVRPIDSLTYAPVVGDNRQVVQVQAINPDSVSGTNLSIVIGVPNGNGGYNSWFTTHFAPSGSTANDVAVALAALINADAPGGVTAVVDGDNLLVKGNPNGEAFQYSVNSNDPNTFLQTTLINDAKPKHSRWSSGPGGFPAIPFDPNTRMCTQRLTYRQALEKAKRSVFRWYRIVNLDPLTGEGKLVVPGIGPIERIQQIVLLDAQIERVVPLQPDLQISVADATASPWVKDFYDGLSREKSAAAYGQVHVSSLVNHVIYLGSDQNANTPPNAEIPVPFSVVSDRYMIQFSDYVYFYGPDGTRRVTLSSGRTPPQTSGSNYYFWPADVVLQTSFHVRNPKTSELIRFKRFYSMSDDKGPPTQIVHEDVESLNVTIYSTDLNANPTAPHDQVNNEQEANVRADYYIRGAAAKYQIKAGNERQYNGLVPIYIDGRVHQVTWVGGEGGCFTTASLDSEHSVYIPRFSDRLRWMYIGSAQAAQAPGQQTSKTSMSMAQPHRTVTLQASGIPRPPGLGGKP